MDQKRVQLLEQTLDGHVMPTSRMDILNKMMMEELILDILLFSRKGTVSNDLMVVPAQRAIGTLTHFGFIINYIYLVGGGWMFVKWV